MRLAITFDTGAERYRWLNIRLLVAAGRLLGTGKIEYAIHRITLGVRVCVDIFSLRFFLFCSD